MQILLTERDKELRDYLESKSFLSHCVRRSELRTTLSHENPKSLKIYLYELSPYRFKHYINDEVGLTLTSYAELYRELTGNVNFSTEEAYHHIDKIRERKANECIKEMIDIISKHTQWEENYRDQVFPMTFYDMDNAKTKAFETTVPILLVSQSFYFDNDTYKDIIQNDTMNLVLGDMRLPRLKEELFQEGARFTLRINADHHIYQNMMGLRNCEYSGVYFTQDCDYVSTEDGYEILEEYAEYLFVDNDGYYYYYEDNVPYEEEEADTFSYHCYGTQHHNSFNRAMVNNEETYFVGYEIEKDDWEAKSTISATSLLRQCKFRKEEDSSIDSEDGYELVSPLYKFDLDIIKKDIENFSMIQQLLDAEMTSKCGMHVSLSHSKFSTSDIFKKLVHWLPLFYGLYPSRTTHDYCEAKTGKDVSSYTAKYSSIYVTPNRLEMRIFPSVYSSKQLLWRLELVKMVLQRPISGLQGMHHYINSGEMKKHLLQVYSNNENRLTSLYQRAERFANKYQLT